MWDRLLENLFTYKRKKLLLPPIKVTSDSPFHTIEDADFGSSHNSEETQLFSILLGGRYLGCV
jgi:hypothetical protein